MLNGTAQGIFLPDSTLKLDFSGGPWEGAEVVLSLDVTIEATFRFQQLAAEGNIIELFQVFGDDILLEWNLLDKKTREPVPATGEGLKGRPMKFGNYLVDQYLAQLKGGEADDSPLVETSPNTDMLAAHSAPMATG